MKQILINATAARSSGALTIIKDFMSYVYGLSNIETHFNLLTATDNVFSTTENVAVYQIPVQSWRSRIKWDNGGLEEWCLQHKIFPDLLVSFQNTCSRFRHERLVEIPQLVYFHQTLPLTPYRWSVWKREEFKLFLYTHFYGFFINQNNKNATYVVQLKYIKERFLQKFSNVPDQKVHVIRPNLPLIDMETVSGVDMDSNYYHFIYPATSLRYKNHKVILKALKGLSETNPSLFSKIKVYFTLDRTSAVYLTVKEMELLNTVRFLGSIPYEELLGYYKSCTGLLFPSCIESFGLPLVEAALFGKTIIASDLPYAREVLEDYDGVRFALSENFKQWADEIEKCCKNNSSYLPMEQNNGNTWKSFLELINELLISSDSYCC